MILDSRNEFADAVTLNTGASGTYLIGSLIDLGALNLAGVNGALGQGDRLYLAINVDTGINAGGAGTLQFQLASDDTAAIATNGTATVLANSPVLTTSTTSGNAGGALAAGKFLWVVELPVFPESERFLGILQVTGTSAISAGKINAFLTADPGLIKNFPDAIN